MSKQVIQTIKDIRGWLKEEKGITLSDLDIIFLSDKINSLYSKGHADGYQTCVDEDMQEDKSYD